MSSSVVTWWYWEWEDICLVASFPAKQYHNITLEPRLTHDFRKVDEIFNKIKHKHKNKMLWNPFWAVDKSGSNWYYGIRLMQQTLSKDLPEIDQITFKGFYDIWNKVTQ